MRDRPIFGGILAAVVPLPDSGGLLVVYKTSLTFYFASTFSSQQGYRRI
jgi:hypothetical protein